LTLDGKKKTDLSKNYAFGSTVLALHSVALLTSLVSVTYINDYSCSKLQQIRRTSGW